MHSTWGTLRLFLFVFFVVAALCAPELRAQESRAREDSRIQDSTQDSSVPRENSKSSTVAPLGDVFVRLARLGDWAECRGDYTPPAWCRDLPGQLNTTKSFTSARARRAEEKQELSKANLNSARALEEFLIATARAGGGDVSVADFRVIETAAFNGNTEAMEMMAWMYMQDIVPEPRRKRSSLEGAYLWYGRAWLAGMAGVKKDMDTLWFAMTREERRRMIDYFDKDRAAQIPGLS